MTEKPTWGEPVVAWAFGHTHWNCDFEEKGVRIVSNQRGYELFGRSAKETFLEGKAISV